MNALLRILASASLFAEQLIERSATGAPLAFRIWRAGDNQTDHGLHRFTRESAKRLMAEQALRGNLYSVDVDHMSLNKESPPESRKAVGWHRLAVRESADGPELWAVEVEWTDAVRAGLEKKPPEWRYFSPAYDVAKDTGEIVSYLNTALTNNPATWDVTALAGRARETRGPMKFAQILAALMSGNAERKTEVERVLAGKKYEALLADLMGGDEEKKSAAIAALAAAFPDDGDGDEDQKKKDAAAKKAAEDEAEQKATKAAEEEAARKASEGEKEQASVAATAKLLTTIGTQDKRLKELEAVNEKSERTKILASRPDLSVAQLKVLEEEPLARLPKLLALIPKPAEDPAAAGRVTATRGATQTGDGASQIRAARLPAAEHEDLLQRMGREPEPRAPYWEGSTKVYPQLTKAAARKILAARGAAQPPIAGRPSPDLIAAVRENALRGATSKGA